MLASGSSAGRRCRRRRCVLAQPGDGSSCCRSGRKSSSDGKLSEPRWTREEDSVSPILSAYTSVSCEAGYGVLDTACQRCAVGSEVLKRHAKTIPTKYYIRFAPRRFRFRGIG